MNTTYAYTFMPLPGIPIQAILRHKGDAVIHYPYNSLPPQRCHISPPLAVINGGRKLFNLDLLDISSTYHGGESDTATYDRLVLLNSIWCRIKEAEDLSKKWDEENRRKQRDEHQGDGTSQSCCTTRSSAKSRRTSELPSESKGGNPTGNKGTRKRHRKTEGSDTGPKWNSDVLAQLGTYHNGVDRIKEWVYDTVRFGSN
jgi:hypothetical protein